jgi:hypothetical protein
MMENEPKSLAGVQVQNTLKSVCRIVPAVLVGILDSSLDAAATIPLRYLQVCQKLSTSSSDNDCMRRDENEKTKCLYILLVVRHIL